MAKRVLATPQITINDDNIAIVPGTFEYDKGEPEISVRAASIGNGSVESVHGVNVETAFSTCKFEMFLTTDLEKKIGEWKELVAQNVIKATERLGSGDSFVITMSGASLTSKVARKASADGTVPFEFAGDVMIG